MAGTLQNAFGDQGDPTQDGAAFHVEGLTALLAEFNSRGFAKDPSAIGVEEMDGEIGKTFFAERFAMFRDRFGTSRMPLGEAAKQVSES